MVKLRWAEDDGRADRRRAVSDYRREIILAAARRVFADQGLEGASLRAIAKAAGYTHGALYFYYASKEAIYADLLAGSLRFGVCPSGIIGRFFETAQLIKRLSIVVKEYRGNGLFRLSGATDINRAAKEFLRF